MLPNLYPRFPAIIFASFNKLLFVFLALCIFIGLGTTESIELLLKSNQNGIEYHDRIKKQNSNQRPQKSLSLSNNYKNTTNVQIQKENGILVEANDPLKEYIMSHKQPRLLLSCQITDCLYCIMIQSIEVCIVCAYPKIATTEPNQCSIPSNQSIEVMTTCTITNCKTCQILTLGILKNEICTECLTGYRFLILQGECYPASQLNDTDQIISYNQYYYLCQEGCKQCEPTTTIELCLACRKGYSMIEGAYMCVKCEGECETCLPSTPRHCLTCFPGFALSEDQNTCLKCQNELCQSCDPFNFTQCTSCRNSFYFDKSECKKCQANCLKCSVPNDCSKCENGYLLLKSQNGTNECFQCKFGCFECEQLSQCTKCYPGYYMTQQKICEPCIKNCRSCKSQSDCLKCLPGYDLFNNDCVKQKPDCILMNQDGNCKVCKSYYELSSNGTCTYIGNQDFSMVTMACKYGLFAQNYWCYYCPTFFKNCIQCNSKYCLKCTEGYFVQSANYTCQKCNLNGCSICQSSDVCLECIDGFYMVEQISPISNETLSFGYCLACDPNCKTCHISGKFCLRCYDGYTLSVDKSCQTIYKLNFLITLNFNYSKEQTKINSIKQYLSSLGSISNISSQGIQITVKFTRIYSGSTVIEGYLDVTNKENLQTAYQKFDTNLTHERSISGVQILSVSLNGEMLPERQKETQQKTDSSLTIILATVIPSVALIGTLTAIVYFCFCRQSDNKEQKKDSDSGLTVEEQRKSEKAQKQTQIQSKKQIKEKSKINKIVNKSCYKQSQVIVQTQTHLKQSSKLEPTML